MMILITIVLILAGIIAVLLITALFVGKEYSVKREIIINRSVPDVFNYIRYLRNQDHFNRWVMLDPGMKKDFRGTDGTKGFVYGWNGNKQAGEGEMEIMDIADGKRMDVQIRFIRPFAGVASVPFILEAVSGGETRVKWGMSSAMKYPMNITLLFVNMDTLLGKELEGSLNNLKNILEK